MKTLTLDQLAQSEFALNPNASLQVTGGADSENPILREALKWLGSYFGSKSFDHTIDAVVNYIGYVSTVDVWAERETNCEIMSGYYAPIH